MLNYKIARRSIITHSKRVFSTENEVIVKDIMKPIEKVETNYRDDAFFKEDELVSQVKMNDEEITYWRRIKNKKPVSYI